MKTWPVMLAGTGCALLGDALISIFPKWAGGSIFAGGLTAMPALTQPGFGVWPGIAIVCHFGSTTSTGARLSASISSAISGARVRCVGVSTSKDSWSS